MHTPHICTQTHHTCAHIIADMCAGSCRCVCTHIHMYKCMHGCLHVYTLLCSCTQPVSFPPPETFSAPQDSLGLCMPSIPCSQALHPSCPQPRNPSTAFMGLCDLLPGSGDVATTLRTLVDSVGIRPLVASVPLTPS